MKQTLLFPIAFTGKNEKRLSHASNCGQMRFICLLVQSILSGWFIKVMVEVIFTPVTYKVVAFLKEREKMDYYDRDTDFNPLIVQTPF